MSNVLLVFQKNPVLGKVKTRLAASVGDEKALQIYKALLNHTKEVVSKVNAQIHIYYSDHIIDQDIWENLQCVKHLQSGNDLGDRMANAFSKAFEISTIKKVVIIGTDCAELNKSILKDSFNALETSDFVIGPAVDGGYYLLGMREFNPVIFKQINWSTSTVFKSTMTKIQELGMDAFLLPTLSDVDTFQDWQKVSHLINMND